jgi:polyketide biosynthesis 3-hydroxy-3-methylglutaryl-CoA synthase-like enzyme PksG
MVQAGIEALNVFGGSAFLDVQELAEYRGLDSARFANLLMKQKSVALPYEDPVTFGVNAAKPLLDTLSPAEKQSIEMVIACSESGIDFGKSISTYLHEYLGLQRNCRLFELKQACYAATAGLQMALNLVVAQSSPRARVLVVATDVSRSFSNGDQKTPSADGAFAEPSSASGAVAFLVSEHPTLLRVDFGANGYYGYEVMDTCRPIADGDAGDADLSLLSYLDCCKQAFEEYRKRVKDVDYQRTFDYLAFHTPFGGMVKGAHRNMMREFAGARGSAIEEDFARRVMPGLYYCQRVGNIMGGTVLLSLASTLDNGDFTGARRVGCFSYGSGCCSEFYSGVAGPDAQARLSKMNIRSHLDDRYRLTMDEYEKLLCKSNHCLFGTSEAKPNRSLLPEVWEKLKGSGRLYLKEIRNFHRLYEWG